MDRLAERVPRRARRVHRGRRRATDLTLHRRRRAGRGVDRRGRHPVPATAPPGADRRGPAVMTTPTPPPARTATDPGPARIAGAPISWGVCEVPNWGHQLTPSRVLAEMQDVGLSATELGPDGFLPADPDQMAAVLAAHQLTAVGGFTPVLMHQPGHDPLPEIDRILGAVRRHPRRGPRALRDVRARRLRQPPDPRRRRLGPVAGQPGPDQRPCRRARRARSAAPARRHHGRERRRGAAGARGLLHLAVPGHRPPADRRHRPGRAHPAVARPHRAHPPQGRRQPHRRQGPRRPAHLHRGRRRGHVPAVGHRRRRRRQRS